MQDGRVTRFRCLRARRLAFTGVGASERFLGRTGERRNDFAGKKARVGVNRSGSSWKEGAVDGG